MKKIALIIISFFTVNVLSIAPVFAVDLMEAYKQALSSDPTFQIQYYQWLSYQEGIGVARSKLLPFIDITGDINRSWNKSEGLNPGTSIASSNYYQNQGEYQITLTQPIFNYTAWEQLQSANATAKSFAANYAAAAQDLIYRTASAYLNVLQNMDILRYTKLEKQYLGQKLDRSIERYKVGLATKTEVDQVQADYDVSVSTELTDENNVEIAKEKLREITGEYYKHFAVLTKDVSLLLPQPTNIDEWVRVAERQNYNLLASIYSVEAANEDIKAQAGLVLPTINAIGTYMYQNNSSSGTTRIVNDGTIPLTDNTNQQAEIMLKADFKVVQGGGVIAKTYQAADLYQKAKANLEETRRNVISTTKQSYLDVVSQIEKIKADKQAVISNTAALNSTEEGYKVGTQTMIDVLQALSSLYNVQTQLVNDQYDYILKTLALKQSAATLSVNDLRDINAWLK